MTRTYFGWRGLSIALGFALTGVEVYGSGEYLYHQQGGWTYIVLLGTGMTSLAAIVPIFAEKAWSAGAYWRSLLTALIIVPSVVLTMVAAADRIGKGRDADAKPLHDYQFRLTAAEKAVTDAKAEADSLIATARAECYSGRKTKCGEREAEAQGGRDRLTQAQERLVTLGAAPTDSQSERMAKVIPWLTKDRLDTWLPIVMPAALAVSSAILIWVGAHQPKPQKPAPEAKARRKPRRDRGQAKKVRLPTQPEPVSNVVALRPNKRK